VGGTLFGVVGTWTPTPAKLSYQWTRNGTAIPGATSTAYLVTAADRGAELRFTVTASKAGYTTLKRVSAAQIVPGAFSSTPTPRISGTVEIGKTVTASTGTWAPTPDSFSYQWKRNGAAISGATSKTYTITQADAAAKLTVTVTGMKANYASASKTSAEKLVPSTVIVRVTSDIVTDTTWAPTVPTVYVVSKDVSVASGSTLTVAAGTVVKFSESTGLTVNGSLVVNGTAAAPVTFTSLYDDTVGGDTNSDGDATTPEPSNWGGIRVDDKGSFTATGMTLAYADTGIAGGGVVDVSSSTIRNNSSTGISVDVDRSGANAGTATVKIRNNTLRDNGGHGISVEATGQPVGSGTQIPIPVIQGNTVTGSGDTAITVHGDKLDGALLRDNSGTGNTINGISLTGTLTTNTTVPLGGLPLLVKSDRYEDLTVATGATLTINAGSVIKALHNGDWGASLLVNGSLVVNGTAAAPVTFTSLYDDTVGGDTNSDGDATTPEPSNWGGIRVDDKGSFTATGMTLAYADTGINADSGVKTIDVSNSVIRNSAADGIHVRVDRSGTNAGTAIVKIRSNTFRSNGDDGIYVATTGQPVGSGTQIPIPIVQNNTVEGSGGTAVVVHGDRLDGSLLRGNSGAGNTINGMSVTGTLTTNATVPLGGLPLLLGENDDYYFDDLTVASGSTLTVGAGSVIKASAKRDWNTYLRVAGSLVVNGTASAPVIFTSLLDDSVGGDTNGDGDATSPEPGDWGGIEAEAGGSVTGSGMLIRYADTAISSDESALRVNVASAHILDSNTCLRSEGGEFTFAGKLADCPDGVVANAPVDARNVDWGTPDGPVPFGVSVPLSGDVSYMPWVGMKAAPVQPVAVPQGSVTCEPTLLVGVRGSGEAPGGPTNISTDPSLYDHFAYNSAKGGFGMDFRGIGMRLQGILSGEVLVTDPWGVRDRPWPALMDEMAPDRRAASSVLPLNYPAASTDLLKTTVEFDWKTAYIRVHLDRFAEYLSSIESGIEGIKYLLREQKADCPEQSIILLGYSQGAMSIHMAMAELADTDSELLENVSGVVLLADPLRSGNENFTYLGTANDGTDGAITTLQKRPGMTKAANYMTSGTMHFGLEYPSSLADRTISLCNAGDAMCDPDVDGLTDDQRWDIHTGYSVKELATWGARAIQSFGLGEPAP
jgi:hypothetical protein